MKEEKKVTPDLKARLLTNDELEQVTGGYGPVGWGTCGTTWCTWYGNSVPVYINNGQYCCLYCYNPASGPFDLTRP